MKLNNSARKWITFYSVQVAYGFFSVVDWTSTKSLVIFVIGAIIVCIPTYLILDRLFEPRDE